MKVLVVEDELVALEELMDYMSIFAPRHQIWYAEHGIEGLKIAEHVKPDLLITDIRMPGMNGIELIRAVKIRMPDTSAIIISGYDDFTYAREGLLLGVKDYLLKPIRKKNFIDTVEKVLQEQESSYASKHHSREWAIVKLLNGYDHALEHEYWKKQELLLVVSVLGNVEAAYQWEPDQAVRELDRLNLPAESMIVFPDLRRRCVLIPIRSPVSSLAMRMWADQVHAPEHNAPPFPQTVYVRKKAGESLHASYMKALQHLEQQIRLDVPTLEEATAERPKHDLARLWDKVRMIEIHISARDMKQLRRELEQIGADLQSMQATMQDIEHFLVDMFTALSYKLTNHMQQKIIDWGEFEHFLKSVSSYPELIEWIFNLLDRFIRHLRRQNLNPSELVQLLMYEVQHAYEYPRSLQQFAKDHHISLSYLSKLFKSEAGVTFSEYVTKVRMKQAQQMLQSSLSISPAEVAMRLGYEDAKYFSQLFKKWVGMSPSEYQRRCRLETAKKDN